jgi:tetratricopeptide (TPR) repeat protein
MILVPLIFLGLVELALRAIGYGYPTSFFVPREIGGQGVFVENWRFGQRFFPPKLARSPSPVVMQAKKPAGTYRIFLFGESAAMGDPRPAYGAGRYLETLLRERFPGAEFEVVCTAMTAINSHAILPIARECARHEGDLWIIYMGNNEMAGPFGANTIFGARALPWPMVRAYLALEQTRTGQWLASITGRFIGGSATPDAWSGLKMFRNHQLAPADPRKKRVYASFHRNLADIVRAGRRAGVPIIISSVASNLRDCAPFGSTAAALLPVPARGDVEKLCASGAAAMAGQQWAHAQTSYEQAARLRPDSAEIQFHLGQCALRTTNAPAAREHFARARDLDTLPFRTDSRLNSLAAEVARNNAGRGVSYVDAAEALAQASPAGIPGGEFFYEHVHLTPEGNYELARAWAQEAVALMPARWLERQSAAWAPPDLCARRLGLTDWNRATILDEIVQRLAEPPYTDQADHAARLKQLTSRLLELRSGPGHASRAEARSLYEEALSQRRNDHWLRHNYAEFLTATGDLKEATVQMEKVRDLIPHHYSASYHLGRLLTRQKKFAEARASLQTALQLRPDFAEAHLELGQISAIEGKLDDGLAECAAAQRDRPDDVRVYLLRARFLEAQNRREEAVQSLRDAVRVQPTSWEAYHRLGIELALTMRFSEAQGAFEQAVRLRPEDAQGHVDLGTALARQGKFEPARTHLTEALRLEPGNAQARDLLKSVQQLENVRAAP